jgi:hypothetical protein
VSRIAAGAGGVAAVHEDALVIYDAAGVQSSAMELDEAAAAVARFGDEWLVLSEGQKHLVHVACGAETGGGTKFAAGKGAIGTFGVGRDDTVVVARGGVLELWSRDDERRWSAKGGPFSQALVARDHVVAVDAEGALVFFSRDKGEALGALRLASTDPPATWRLADVDGTIVVLALGEWLVWIHTTTRKTVRRVRARAKVVAISADAENVAVAVEDGYLQTFRSATGEPRAAVSMDDGGSVSGIALGAKALFTIGSSSPEVRVAERQTLDVSTPAGSPISALAVRGRVAAAGDRTGRVRILEGADSSEPREIGSITTGEATHGLYVGKGDVVVAAGARVMIRVGAPWKTPRPVALRTAPTAFAADDAYAFSGTPAGEVDVYELETGRQVTTYALSSDDRITALARIGGALLVVGTGALDGRVFFVDVANAKVVHRVAPHEEAFGVTSLASDARGRIVASGGDDCSIALLDPGKGRVLARLRVNETPVRMAFEPSGRRLACVFGDGTAALVTLAPKGATVSDLGIRGATQVAWGDELVFGFKDGHVESGQRHARPSDRPAMRQ